jgi:hypothetical protein
MVRALYGQRWTTIARQMKDAAGWKCKRCGIQCRKPGEPYDGDHTRTLTVGHLDRQPWNLSLSNLWPMCVPCHLAYDRRHNQRMRWFHRKLNGKHDGEHVGYQLHLFAQGLKVREVILERVRQNSEPVAQCPEKQQGARDPLQPLRDDLLQSA